MNTEKMCNQTINLYRQLDAKKQLIWKDSEHLSAALVSLDIKLGQLAEVCGLDYTMINGIKDSSKEMRLEKLVLVIRDFFLYSSISNWNDKLILSDKDNQRLNLLKKDNKSELDTLYLSIKNMILKSFYQKDPISFRHAWVLLMKWAKTDLDFTDNEISFAFEQKLEKDLKLM